MEGDEEWGEQSISERTNSHFSALSHTTDQPLSHHSSEVRQKLTLSAQLDHPKIKSLN